jgi:putative spermidine/putrescine transport system permease protein
MATTSAPQPAAFRRRISAFLYRHRPLKLGLLLTPPLGWLVVVYLGALAALLFASLWGINPLSFTIVHTYSLGNFRTLWDNSVYRTVTFETVRMAVFVTLTDAVLAFPLAYFMVRVAGRRLRAALFVGVLMPLWSSYLIKAYTWKLIVATNGPLNWSLGKLGLPHLHLAFTNTSLWITLSYIWLPYMVLPVYAALDRIPASYLEASGDLGARPWRTFRRVILPLALPGVAAGSIFTFSLTLGDYIAVTLLTKSQFIGNLIYVNAGVAGNLPLAAAISTIPIVIMVVYLTLIRRTGAFEAL